MRILNLCFACLFLLSLPVLASAQSSGLFGSRSTGGGISAPGSTFQGSPGNAVEQSQAGAGEVSGNERFVRDSRQPGQFVGADSGDATNFFSQLGNAFGGGGLQGLNRGNNAGNLNNNQDTPLRTKLSLGFEYGGPAADTVTTRLETLLTKIPNLETEDLSVALDGQTAVLTGRVASDHQRQMAARVAKLQPGVWAVRNELTVGTDPADDDVLPVPPAPGIDQPAATPADAGIPKAPSIDQLPEVDSTAAPPPAAPKAPVFDN